MKERPIIFSAPMIRALLDGSKTQTRRVVKHAITGPNPPGSTFDWHHPKTNAWVGAHGGRFEFRNTNAALLCPYGQPGGPLYVKESWHWDEEDNLISYRADNDSDVDVNKHETGLAKYNWRPSIFMPRAISRITLEITGVRVERLQDISRGDAMDEGCPFPNMAQGDDPRKWYADLWASINGPVSWAANPWVWVVEFEKEPQNE